MKGGKNIWEIVIPIEPIKRVPADRGASKQRPRIYSKDNNDSFDRESFNRRLADDRSGLTRERPWKTVASSRVFHGQQTLSSRVHGVLTCHKFELRDNPTKQCNLNCHVGSPGGEHPLQKYRGARATDASISFANCRHIESIESSSNSICCRVTAPISARSQSRSRSKYTSFIREYAFDAYVRETSRLFEGQTTIT